MSSGELPMCVRAFCDSDSASMHIRVVARVRPSLPSEVNKLLSFVSTDPNDLNATVDSDRYQEAVRVLDSRALEVTMPKEKKNSKKQSADPYLKKAETSHRSSVIQVTPNKNDGQTTNRQSMKKIYDDFDQVCGANASQAMLFNAGRLPELIEASVAHGYNGTVFAYGQTGSGKTYTMSGVEEKIISRGFNNNPETDGLIPRGLTQIFGLINELRKDVKPGQNIKYSVRTSFLEIYNETVIDLINSSKVNGKAKTLQLRQQPKPLKGFFVDGLLILDTPDLEDVMAVAAEGHKNRKVASHEMNKDSSRSHSIFTVYIDMHEGDSLRYTGKINFVDLAGSENLKQSQSRGGNAKETGAINKSLFTLGTVISTLCDISQKKKPKNSHVPYRDSVLTKLLMDALSGAGLTAMIACVSPLVKHGDETHRTLQYAIRAKNIEVRPSVKVNTQQDKYEKLIDEVRRLNGINQGLEKFITSHGLTVPAELSVSGSASHRGGKSPVPAHNVPQSSFFMARNNNSARDALMTSPSDGEDFFVRRTSNNKAWAQQASGASIVRSVSPVVATAQKQQHGKRPITTDKPELEREVEFLREKVKNLENMFLKRRPSSFTDSARDATGANNGSASEHLPRKASSDGRRRESRNNGHINAQHLREERQLTDREVRIRARKDAPTYTKVLEPAPMSLYPTNVSSRRKGNPVRTNNPHTNAMSPMKSLGGYAEKDVKPSSRRRNSQREKHIDRYSLSPTPSLDEQIARMEQEKDRLTERLVSSGGGNGRADHRDGVSSRRHNRDQYDGYMQRDSGLKGKKDRAPRRSVSTAALRGY